MKILTSWKFVNIEIFTIIGLLALEFRKEIILLFASDSYTVRIIPSSKASLCLNSNNYYLF